MCRWQPHQCLSSGENFTVLEALLCTVSCERFGSVRYSHFTDEKTEAQKDDEGSESLSDLPKVKCKDVAKSRHRSTPPGSGSRSLYFGWGIGTHTECSSQWGQKLSTSLRLKLY